MGQRTIPLTGTVTSTSDVNNPGGLGIGGVADGTETDPRTACNGQPAFSVTKSVGSSTAPVFNTLPPVVFAIGVRVEWIWTGTATEPQGNTTNEQVG
jgi:hypothetical protein